MFQKNTLDLYIISDSHYLKINESLVFEKNFCKLLVERIDFTDY